MRDEQIANILSRESEEFRKLSDEHKHLDTQLLDMSVKHHLTADEEIEKKRLQKMKLLKKDRMAEIIRGYKKEHSIH
ncbi:MAG: DUF465 domain-containing protein [Actinomycetota bacterium]|nr:DUF465 domain-containing protein [Actinomycetota bacterium]